MIHTSLVFLFVVLQTKSQIFIDYGVGGEGRQLFKYFYDIQDGFYVDIGAYDPIFASNTLNLYTQGWGGINVDASPERLNKFFMERPDQTNLNFAVGEENTILTLYELDEDSSSTVSVKVKDYASGFKPLVKQIKVPSISMKQICDRYYYRKPIFLNLDIQGYGSKALQTNDWNNPKCVPQVIFSEINEQTRISGLPLPETILTQHGYKKIPSQVGLNQIYIHSSVYDKYMAKAKQASNLLSRMQILNVNTPSYAVAAYLKIRTSLVKHYQPKRDGIHYKFARYDQPINLDQLNRQSNLLGQMKNRPIVVYHFNPHSSVILVENGNFTSKELKMNQYTFTQINVTKPDNTKYSVYVFDHQFSPKKQLNIIDMSANHQNVSNKTYQPSNISQSQPQPQNKTSLSQQLINQYKIQVQKQKEELSSLNENFLQQISTANAKFDQLTRRQIINLEQVSKKLSNIQYKINQFSHTSSPNKSSPNVKQVGPQKSKYKGQALSNNLASQLANLSTLQYFTMIVIAVMSILLCATACATRKTPKTKKVYRLAARNEVAASQLSMYSQK